MRRAVEARPILLRALNEGYVSPYRSSLTEIVQIIGRATRDAPGKTRARFTNLDCRARRFRGGRHRSGKRYAESHRGELADLHSVSVTDQRDGHGLAVGKLHPYCHTTKWIRPGGHFQLHRRARRRQVLVLAIECHSFGVSRNFHNGRWTAAGAANNLFPVWRKVGGGLALSLILLPFGRRRTRPFLAVIFLTLVGIVATGCATPSTKSQDYTIAVTASGGSVMQTTNITLTVNQ